MIVNLEVREIAEACRKRLKGKNYNLVQQLFLAKCHALFQRELVDFQSTEPNKESLAKWFSDYCTRSDFLERLIPKQP